MSVLFQDPARERELLSRFVFCAEDHFYIRKINESLFDHPLHKQLFAAIRVLSDKHYVVTRITVEDYLRKNSRASNTEQLIELIFSLSASPIKAEEHIPHLTEIWYKRKLNHMISKASLMLANVSSHESIINFMRKEIADVGTTRDNETLQQVTQQTYEKILQALTEGANLIESGIKGIDEAIGLTESMYVLICGKSSEGKSSLMNQLLVNMYLLNVDISILYISMEINKVKLIENLVSILTKIPKDRLRGKGSHPLQESEMETVRQALETINSFDLDIEYGPVNAEECALLIDLFVAKKRSMFGEKRKLIIISDHHLYIKVDGGDQQKAINDFSKMLVNKKEEHRLLSILICQLHNRYTEERDHTGMLIPPALKWLQYPGTLQQDCDSSIAIWRKNRPLPYEPKVEVEEAELWIEKNRDGQPMIGIPVRYIAKYSQFEDIPPVHGMSCIPFDPTISSREKEMPSYEDFEDE